MDKSFAGCRILVVEDEMMILMMMEEMLADLGASVTAATTVKQALAGIEAHAFDAATLDLNLDGNESYPVADTSPCAVYRSSSRPATANKA